MKIKKLSLILCLVMLSGNMAIAEEDLPHLKKEPLDPAKNKQEPFEKPVPKNKTAKKFGSTVPKIKNKPAEEKQELITLELKDIDIVEVLKILARKGNLNIIIGQNVKGRITLFLKDVTVWNALKSVFEIANLAYIKKGDVYQIITGRDYLQLYGREFFDNREMKIIPIQNAVANDVLASVKGMVSKIGNINVDQRTNSLIVIDAKENIEFIEKAILNIDRPLYTEIFALQYMSITQGEEIIKGIISGKGKYQKDASTNKIIVSDIVGNIEKIRKIIDEYDVPPNLETKVYQLNYGSYEKLESKIKEFLTPNLGKISSDERTNTIVIIDLPSNIINIDRVIEAYDEKLRQVLIEAKIVQVSLNDRFQYGINWNYIFDNVAETLNADVLSAFELASASSDSTTGTEDDPPESETSFADRVTSSN